MKIAQIAPLYESCPPRLYGGTERIASYLTEELVRQGHDVTLFASGDSQTKAKLVRCSDTALRLNPKIRDAIPYHILMNDEACRRADEFDILHFHVDLMHFPLIRPYANKTVTTLHGRLDMMELQPFYAAFPDIPLISISHNQRRPLGRVNWVGNVYHGLPREQLPLRRDPAEGYLAFLGRISPEKRPDRAIKIAVRSGMRLKIAAKIDKVDQPYWDEEIAPLVAAHDNVEYIGEINEQQKVDFLGNAAAMLFPIDWPEPFGIVMIEAMACGTPVVAFRCGSVPEVLVDGVSGFIVDDMDQAVDAVSRIHTLDRAVVRATFEKDFTVERMARDYVEIYKKMLGLGAHKPDVGIRSDVDADVPVVA
jgi:glycosyltransferase involved in cell wall biosynthesis